MICKEQMNPLTYVLAGAAIFFYMHRGPSSSAPINTITLYHANWCHFCKEFMPVWQQLGTEYAGIQVRAVEQMENNEYKVSGYPTVVLKTATRTITYKGPRTLSALQDFIASRR
jgi:thiol-disulfide isomerase/thioredoxin